MSKFQPFEPASEKPKSIKHRMCASLVLLACLSNSLALSWDQSSISVQISALHPFKDMAVIDNVAYLSGNNKLYFMKLEDAAKQNPTLVDITPSLLDQ